MSAALPIGTFVSSTAISCYGLTTINPASPMSRYLNPINARILLITCENLPARVVAKVDNTPATRIAVNERKFWPLVRYIGSFLVSQVAATTNGGDYREVPRLNSIYILAASADILQGFTNTKK
jgi:hypothetical protein